LDEYEEYSEELEEDVVAEEETAEYEVIRYLACVFSKK
jgi:hypothetical protein